MAVEFKIGPDAIISYRRLSYTPWHAIAELVDNSTQSYFDNKSVLDEVYAKEGKGLLVSIVYDKDEELLRVYDNAMGMSLDELTNALHVAQPPKDTSGRSKYGMGLKTSACWIGNTWTVTTKKFGETVEHQVEVNVNRVAKGVAELPYSTIGDRPKDAHYTIIEIRDHNQKFKGRTLGKIRDFLRSMYRSDFRNEVLHLEWSHTKLAWEEPELLKAKDGSTYRKEFHFEVSGKHVDGWVGILARGSRADAGFSILHSGRVVRGWPDSWRPGRIYGQIQGSNDLINQRLVGEVSLDGFDVSHTKDDILWGDLEDDVEELLFNECEQYRAYAKIPAKRREGEDGGPSAEEIDVAVDELKRELTSPEMVDAVKIETIPSEEAVAEYKRYLKEQVTKGEATFAAKIDNVTVKGFLATDLSPSDPYVTVESTNPTEVIVVVNVAHPHWSHLKGSEGVHNYLEHCTFDAIAEWKARHKTAKIDPDTIKLLKDALLRVPFYMESHAGG